MTFEYDEIEDLNNRIYQLEAEVYELSMLVKDLRAEVDDAWNEGYAEGRNAEYRAQERADW